MNSITPPSIAGSLQSFTALLDVIFSDVVSGAINLFLTDDVFDFKT